MPRRINTEGHNLIKRWEGFRPFAYDDKGNTHRPVMPGDEIKGTLTIGYGHTGPDVYVGQTVTEEEAQRFLIEDLREAEAAVERLITVPLTDHQFAALVSFTYNLGGGSLERSTLRRVLNAGRYNDVPAQLMRWVHHEGEVSDGLIGRRAAEAGLWARESKVASRHVAPDEPKGPVKENATKVGGGLAAGGGGVMIAERIVSESERAAGYLTSGNIVWVLVGVAIIGVAAWAAWRWYKGRK